MMMTLTLLPNTSIEAACAALANLPFVEYAEAAQTLEAHQTTFPAFPQPNDPLSTRQYHIDRIRTREAWNVLWNLPATSRNEDSTLLVAVCDTGVDWEHEDLAQNIWTNRGESGRDAEGRDKRTNGVDDDRNGKIDDWHGWDFVGSISEDERAAALFREDNDPKPRINGTFDPAERLQHGTHVAGVLAAVMNNAKGGVGIAPRCRILPIKCSTDGTRVGGISRGYEAMLYAAQMGAKIIVCSFGGGAYRRFEQDVINTVTAMGVLVVVAAGNDNKITDDVDFPASYDNVLCVGASNQADRAASFSDAGVKIHVFAPGEAIISTLIGNTYNTNAVNEWNGTSMATPIVAGVAAMVRLANPTWTPRQVVQQIRGTSENVLAGTSTGAASGRPLGYFGRVNALNALTMRPPGLTTLQTSIGAASGIIQDVQPTSISLQCSNVLAPAQNVRVWLLSLDGRAISLSDVQSLGNLGTNETRTVTFRIQLEPAAAQGSGVRTASFAVIFQADGGGSGGGGTNATQSYVNYERINVSYNIRPVQGSQILASTLIDFGETSTPRRTNIELRNIGSESLALGTISLSGVNANEFLANLPSTTLAGGSSMLVPVDFIPLQRSAGLRTATFNISAQTQGMTALSGVQGGYDFSSEQSVYQEFTDGTTLRNGIVPFDDAQFDLGIGFPFVFNGTSYDRISVSSNGFCAFAPAQSLVMQGSPVVQPLGTFVRANGYIAVCGADLTAAAVSVAQALPAQALADVRFKTEGSSPNRVFIVQWRNANAKTAEGRIDTSVVVNAQMRLYEGTNRIECVYGNCSAARFFAADIGLRGASAQDFHSRRISEDIAARWANSAEARSFEEQCEFTPTNLPMRGLTFRWTPRPTMQPRTRTAQTLSRSTELRARVPMTLTPLTAINDAAMAQGRREISVSPNPAREEARLVFWAETSSEVSISIKNSLGAEVRETSYHAQFGENTVVVPVRTLPNGIYFVTLTTPHQTLQQRLLVLR